MLTIRHETASDHGAVSRLTRDAFGRDDEGRLVDNLRAAGRFILSLVAEDDGVIVGHVGFSPMIIASETASWDAVCLAPISVAPSRQRSGIGGRLIEAGLGELRESGHTAVCLLGHPTYYPRFGFRAARDFDVHYGDDRDAAMAIELVPGALDKVSGTMKFAPEFAEFE